MTTITLTAADPAPPVAKIVPHPAAVNGDARVDNYFWLRDRDDPDTLKYLEAENRLHRSGDEAAPRRCNRSCMTEILGRIQQTDLSVPTKPGRLLLLHAHRGRQAIPDLLPQARSLEAPEEVLLDGNAMAEGKKYFRVGNFAASPNHKLLAYSVDFDGDEAYTIHVKDLATGRLLADEIPNTYYSLEWGNDNATFFYTVLDAAKRPYKVFRHALGVKQDALVYHETDERFTVELDKTPSRAYILINIGSSLTSEVRYVHVGSAEARIPRASAARSGNRIRRHASRRFVVHPHQRRRQDVPGGGSAGQRSVAGELERNDRRRVGRDHRKRHRVQGLSGGRRARSRADQDPHPEFRRPARRITSIFRSRSIRPGLGANAEYDTKLLRFIYTSLVTPDSVFDYNMETRDAGAEEAAGSAGRLRSGASINRSGFMRPRRMASRCRFRWFIRRGCARTARRRCCCMATELTGSAWIRRFTSDRLSLLDRGFVYAIAHIRGGGRSGQAVA